MARNPWLDEPEAVPAVKPVAKPVAKPVVAKAVEAASNPWLSDVPRGTVPDTLDRAPDVKPTAAVAEGVTRGAPRPSAPDPLNAAVSAGVQAVATPLERTLNALTAPWRMGASAAGEATGAFPKSGNAAVAGLKEPGRTYSAVAGHLAEQVPDEVMDVQTPDFPGDAPIHRPVPIRAAIKGAGIAADFADPIMLASFGGVTEAGQLYRAAKIGHEAALLERAGALTAEEAAVAQQKVDAAAKTIAEVVPQLKREGTLASNGRALVSIGGRTAPPLAAGGGLGAAEGVLAKVGRTRLARGVSGLFQPPEKRVSDAIRARSYAVKASGDVAAREAGRGLKDLTDEYPDLLKALGGDRQAFDDALSLAHERSQAKRFDVPTDWMSSTERTRYWGTDSPEVQAQLKEQGALRAHDAVPQFLNRDEARQWRTANSLLVRNTQLRIPLETPTEYTEQLAQKHLDSGERSELQRLFEQRARRETKFLKSGAPNAALANPIAEKRIGELQDVVAQRANTEREGSVALLNKSSDAALAKVQDLTERAQDRAHLQALRGSVDAARRMYFRGAAPAVAQRFGDYASKMIDRLNVRNASMFSNTVREGVKLHQLADPQAYLMHAATPEFQQSILDHARESGMAEKGMGWREFSEKHGAQLTRKLRMTAVEANELGAAGKLAANGYKPVKQAFYTNPFIAQVMREQAGGKAQGFARFIRELANTYGHKVGSGPIPKGWRTVPNNIEGIGDKVAFSPEVADLLGKHLEQLRDPGHLVQAYDRLNQIWKQWTLGIFPVYHTRNEIGDLSNALLGGLDVSWAGPAIGEVLSGTRLGQKAAGRGITFDDGRHFPPGAMRDEAEGMGVVQSGQLQQEVEKRVLGPLADPDAGGLPFAPAVKRIKRAVSEAGAGETGGRRLGSKVGAGLHAAQRQLTDNRAVDAALTVGNIREQALRMALYIDRRSRGWSPEAASLWVRKHLIDYGQLSQHENETMRRVFPFYAWTRHNAPLQLEYLFAKPGNFATLQHARQTAADNQDLGVGDEPLPQFLSEGLPIRTGTSAEGNPEFWRLDGTLPMSDALLPLSPAIDPAAGVRRASSLLSWVPQEVAEQVSDSDWYRSMVGKNVPITEWEGQQGSFLGMPMNKRVIHALSNARVLTELNRLNPGDVFGTDKQPAYGGLGSVRERPDLDPAQRWLNLFLGRGYAVDEARNADDWHRAVKHQLDLLESEIRRDEAQGKTAQASAARRRYERILEHPEEISPDMAH